MQAFHELIKTDLVLVIGQLSELLHGTQRLVTFQDNSVEYLSHNEEVVNLLPQNVFQCAAVNNFKLCMLLLVNRWSVALALST